MANSTLPNSGEPDKPFIILNTHSVEKLNGTNYQQWQLQVHSLLVGYDLHHFVDGTTPIPSKTITSDKETKPNPAYNTWYRQDRLLFGALAGTLSPSIGPLITCASSTCEAWKILATTYALPSRGHVKQLKHKLKHITKGSSTITDYMQKIKSVVDELAMLGTLMSTEDVTDLVIEGLRDPSYQSVIDAINARDTPISFPELHEKLINRELLVPTTTSDPSLTFPAVAHPTYTRPNSNKHHFSPRSPVPVTPVSNQNPKNPFKGRCQWCNIQFHTLAFCPTFKALYPDIRVPRHPRLTAQAHPTTLTAHDPSPWLMDSGASHHVTSDLSNLSLHYPYDGTDEIVIGDGSSLPISHSGSVSLHLPHSTVSLLNVLCVPSMHKNIISVSKLCLDNNLCIEFLPTSFSLKDPRSGAILLTGPARDGVYYWPSSSPQAQALTATLTGGDLHHRFGHPSTTVLN